MKSLRMDIKPPWNKQILDISFRYIWKSSFHLQVLAFLKYFSFGGDIVTKQKYVKIKNICQFWNKIWLFPCKSHFPNLNPNSKLGTPPFIILFQKKGWMTFDWEKMWLLFGKLSHEEGLSPIPTCFSQAQKVVKVCKVKKPLTYMVGLRFQKCRWKELFKCVKSSNCHTYSSIFLFILWTLYSYECKLTRWPH